MRALAIFIMAEVAWVASGVPGHGWALLVPFAIWLAYVAGELHGEGRGWQLERADRTERTIDVARMLRDPAFVRTFDGKRADALRDRAMWN